LSEQTGRSRFIGIDGHQGVLHEARSVQPDKALCVDVLAPEATARSSAAAVSTITSCCFSIDEHKLPREAFEWYLDLRSVPMAVSAWASSVVAWVCGLEHVGRRFRIRVCCTAVSIAGSGVPGVPGFGPMRTASLEP
jgi:hypothetical protein